MSKLVLSSFSLLSLAIIVISYIGMWKCFEKAGEKGWKAIIPFYNYAILYKISGMSPYWAILNLSTWICELARDLYGNYAGVAMSYSSHLSVGLILYLVAFGLSIFELVISILMIINFCHSFNKGGGYIAGMFFVSPIFYMIIGFGDAKYIGPKGVKSEEEVVNNNE